MHPSPAFRLLLLALVLGCDKVQPARIDSPPAPPPVASTAPALVPFAAPAPSPTPPATGAGQEAAAPVALNLREVLGRGRAEVDEALGANPNCETVSPSGVGKVPKCAYRDGNVEVVFIHDRADWVTVYGTDSRAPDGALDLPLDPASLGQLGLVGAPTGQTPIGIFWKGSVNGVREVSMFGQKGGKVSYVLVKGTTP